MANNYVLYSDQTFRELVIPDWIAELHKWPLTTVDEEENELDIAWSLYDGFDQNIHRAGDPIPVKELDDGKLQRCNEDEATDFAVPYNSVGGDFHMWIKSLADAKPIPYEACMLSVPQMKDLLIVEPSFDSVHSSESL
tara:strand:- start:130 stop:543 length:414 start_codon:yes stop_codon:yes gene_type:complete